MAKRQYVPGGKAIAQLKDLKLAQKMAQKAGIGKLPHLESTVKLYEILTEQGKLEWDHSALHSLLWQNPGLSLGLK
jgi:3-hydroxyisobutyrate dehydrogenase-like beta-hydroxyacid dehydrogenase